MTIRLARMDGDRVQGGNIGVKGER